MALHPETNVQRADTRHRNPTPHSEASDAPPGKVIAAAAALFSLVLIGLTVAAVAIHALDGRHGLVMHDPPAPLFPKADLPPLLAHPVEHRREVESEARRHLDPAKIEAAMKQVEQGSKDAKQ